jgi:hypothetical protein
MRIGILSAAMAAVLAGCVGDKAELGGVDNRMAPPATARVCNPDEMKVVKKGEFIFPGDAVMFMRATQRDVSFTGMKVRYDVNEQGVPGNISYAGNPDDLRHATRQKIIRAIVDGVKDTRYAWIGAPAFATGCTYSMSVTGEFKDS